MHFVLDAGVLLVIILLAVVGAKKGFIKSCADFCGSLLAMIGAGVLSGPAAEWVYSAFFRTALEEKITTAVAGLGAADAVDTVFSDFPDVIQRALNAAGITEGSVMAQLQSGCTASTACSAPCLAACLRFCFSGSAWPVCRCSCRCSAPTSRTPSRRCSANLFSPKRCTDLIRPTY